MTVIHLLDVPTEDGMSEVVDDGALIGDGIAALVESLGYNAVTFPSAEHFLRSDVIAETTCLITDVQIPGLSGLELQEVLLSQGHLTPVIVITAYPNEKHKRHDKSSKIFGCSRLGRGNVSSKAPALSHSARLVVHEEPHLP